MSAVFLRLEERFTMQPVARPLSVGLLLVFAATHAQAAEIDEIFRTQDSNATTPFPSRKHAPPHRRCFTASTETATA